MTGVRKLQTGELIALRPGQPRVDPGAGAAVRATGLDNVIPFMRPRSAEPHAPTVVLPADAARLPVQRLGLERARLAAFVAISLALHGGLFLAFWREPPPLASIGQEVISVELVLGATAPAGVAQKPGEQELEAAAGATDPQTADPQRTPEKQATEQPQDVEVARQETAPEQTTTLERQADERTPDDNATAPREQPNMTEPKPAVAMVESPNPDMATAAPRENPPDTTEVSLLPQPEEKPVEVKPDPQPKQAAAPKPVKTAAPAKERKRIAAPTAKQAAKQPAASNPSTAASNVGVGRSSNDSNYRGIVWAHLARYKQSGGGSVGTAMVSFSIGGSGGVTGVRLVRASGVASIDQEVQAMVRRASPFPPPPGGRPQSFAIPVQFRSQ